MDKYVKDLQVGDKVCGHGIGWITVKGVRDLWKRRIEVVYDTERGEVTIDYWPHDVVFVV